MRNRLLTIMLVIALCMGNVTTAYAISEESITSSNNEDISYDQISSEDVSSEELSSEEVISEEEISTYTDETDSEEIVSDVITTEESVEDRTSEEEILTDVWSELSLQENDANYSVDKTSPYSGEYLIMTNTNKINATDRAESVGILPVNTSDEEDIDLEEEENIWDYDDNGKALIDANSILDDPGEPDNYSEEIELQEGAEYNIGTKKEMLLATDVDSNGKNVYTSETCVCIAIGEHSTVWVKEDDPIYVNNSEAMVSYMNTLCNEFESKYASMIAAFGDLDYADHYGDKDGKVAFICYDIRSDFYTNSNSYTGGFFNSGDMSIYSAGNKMDCLHIDSWQGMGRSKDGNSLTKLSNSYRITVHELQHMILWSNCRRIEEDNGKDLVSVTVPSWLNEGFSEAAIHMFYNNDSRVNYYNTDLTTRGGKTSLINWEGKLSNYSLSYLFSQYIRTQYAQKTGGDGWNIYKNSFSRVNRSKSDASTEAGAELLDSIALELGVPTPTLIENFYIALFVLDETGPYGFNGEAWANRIVPIVTTEPASSLRPGASQIIEKTDDFVPEGYGENIRFAGIDNTTEEQEILTISGGNRISTFGGTLQLTASTNKNDNPEVEWSIPNSADRNIVKVDNNGLVTAIHYGNVTIRASLVSDPSIYSDTYIEVEEEANRRVSLKATIYNIEYGSRTVKFLSTNTEGAKIYYTTENRVATKNDSVYTDSGVKIALEGKTFINVLSTAEGFYDTTARYSITVEKLAAPDTLINIIDKEKVEVSFTGSLTTCDIYYTLDGTSPLTDGKKYLNAAMVCRVSDIKSIKAVARKKGYIDSDITEKSDLKIIELKKPKINYSWIEADKKYEIVLTNDEANSSAEIWYTIDGNMEKKYTGPFYIDGSAEHILNAYAKQAGCAKSEAAYINTKRIRSEYTALSATPRIAATTYTLNKQYAKDNRVPVIIMPIDGDEIFRCDISGDYADRFEIAYRDDDTWLLSLKDNNIKTGSYKLELLLRGTQYATESPKRIKITLKVTDKSPAVTVKKISVYKNYENVVVPLAVTSKEGNVTIDGLSNKINGFTQNFELIDNDGDGKNDSIVMSKKYNELITGTNGKPVMTGYLNVTVDGYKTQKVPVTISLNTTTPKITQSSTNIKYNYDSFIADGCKATTSLVITNRDNKKVRFAVANSSDARIDTSAKEYAKVAGLLDRGTPITVNSNGDITIKFADSIANQLSGTYTVPVMVRGSSDIGTFGYVAVKLKFTVNSQKVALKTTPKISTLKLNKYMKDHANTDVAVNCDNVEIKDIICTAMPAKGKYNLDEKVKLRYNKDTSKLEAYYDKYTNYSDIICNSYTFICTPQYVSPDSGVAIAGNQQFKITVKIVEKYPTVQVTTKGSINVLNRSDSYITCTVKKNNFSEEYDVDNEYFPIVAIVAPNSLAANEADGSKIFELTEDAVTQFAQTGSVKVRLKSGATVERGKKYVFRLRYLIKNNTYMHSNNIKVTPIQQPPKLIQDKIPTLYKTAGIRNRTGYINVSTNISTIKIGKLMLNSNKNSKLPAGIKVDISDENIGSVMVTLNDNSVKTGTYVINMYAIYEDEMFESNNTIKAYPVSIKVVVK